MAPPRVLHTQKDRKIGYATRMAEKPIDPALAAKALEEGTKAFAKFAAMEPYLERVQLFKGSMLAVKFKKDAREKGDPDNFQFEKLVVKAYRALAGE
jgi:hypothetical protein